MLIVDNTPEMLDRWYDAAVRAGDFDILTAQSADAARVVMHHRSIDIMVTDLCLSTQSENSNNPSGAEGLALIRECRELFPEAKIVAITYYLFKFTEIGVLALEAGADEFISGNWEYIQSDVLLEQQLRLFAKLLQRRRIPVLSGDD